MWPRIGISKPPNKQPACQGQAAAQVDRNGTGEPKTNKCLLLPPRLNEQGNGDADEDGTEDAWIKRLLDFG